MPFPAGSVRVAVIVAVPVGAITGVGVESLSWPMGIGGPIVLSMIFTFCPVAAPRVAVVTATPEAWISGTCHEAAK
jgi:hypothetical protein